MTTTTNDLPPAAPRAAHLRIVWMVAGGLAIAAAGAATGFAMRSHSAAPAVPSAASIAADESVVEPRRTPEAPNAQGAAETKPTVARTAPAKPHTAAPAHRTPATANRADGSIAGSDPTPLPTQPAAVCARCGVIEAVHAVEQKGQGTGLGAVAGGVAGAAVGNQFGHGNGKALMTVLGAVGGGLAGHEIEKNVRKETVYEVRVRMDDGSLRTLTQKTAPTPGTRVTVEGNELRTVQAPPSGGRMVRTSGGT